MSSSLRRIGALAPTVMLKTQTVRSVEYVLENLEICRNGTLTKK